jgi:hypothetical protein
VGLGESRAQVGERGQAIGARRSAAAALVVRLALFSALAWLYVAGATMHAERVNWFKARGDQSWFLHIAQVEYRNWHGIGPPQMLRRNIMPLYPAYLALFYDPSISDPDYFVIAKRWSIRLSLALLVVLGLVFARYLPALAAANLTLIVAFGYWIFKAGYAQPELLYYFLLFLTFLACCHLLHERRPGRSVALAAGAFYNPISATGTTRYIIAHLTPFFFVLAYFTTMEPFRRTTWRIGRLRIGTIHADLAVSATLAFSIVFVLWARLETTYGGF